jgi:hypothetical protein
VRTICVGIVLLAQSSVSAADAQSAGRPSMEEGVPRPGHFVKVIAPEYRGTQVFHAIYLPTDWKHGATYPVIVEFPPNSYPPRYKGLVEDCKLGYYESGGSGFIWIVLPFVNTKEKKNQPLWWGDIDATVEYCKRNVKRACETFGGDRSKILLTGFSRGAIACGYIGLHDDEIAGMWAGLIADAHFDGGSFTLQGAKERLARLRGRPCYIIYGENDEAGKANSLAGAEILRQLGETPKTMEIPGLNHTDTWIEKPSLLRDELRAWISDVIKNGPAAAVSAPASR